MMESLHLPNDLHWEGKMEPLSPSQLALTSFEEYELFEDNFANELEEVHDSDNDNENTFLNLHTIANFEKLQELILLAAENDDCENDQWLSEKDLPFQNDDYSTDNIGFYPIKNPNTEDLMKEFDLVYDAIEYTHLTPPQTPPSINKITCDESFIAVQEITEICRQQHQHLQQQHNEIIKVQEQNILSPSSSFMSTDLAYELEVVDELVRTRAQDLSDWNDDDSLSVASPSSSSSPRSESSSSSSNESKHESNDEWYPEPKTTKRKTKSYSRSNDDRKSRKKEQNKNAATRYRQKKKAEVEVILGEEQVLHNINKKLQMKHSDLKREIKYLKSLMREIYTAKGVL